MSLGDYQFDMPWKGHRDDLPGHRRLRHRIDESPFEEIATGYKSPLIPHKPHTVNVRLAPLMSSGLYRELSTMALERGIHQRGAWESQLWGQALTAGADSIGLRHSASLRKQEKFQLWHDIIGALVEFSLKP